jgi:hypothetical protein
MLKLDDSDFTDDHKKYFHEWANNLGVSVEVLLGRIVIATSEGDLYAENASEDRPSISFVRNRLAYCRQHL